MNKREKIDDSLLKFVQKIVPIFNSCSSIEQFLLAIENLESNLQNLEERVNDLQQEIEILNNQP